MRTAASENLTGWRMLGFVKHTEQAAAIQAKLRSLGFRAKHFALNNDAEGDARLVQELQQAIIRLRRDRRFHQRLGTGGNSQPPKTRPSGQPGPESRSSSRADGKDHFGPRSAPWHPGNRTCPRTRPTVTTRAPPAAASAPSRRVPTGQRCIPSRQANLNDVSCDLSWIAGIDDCRCVCSGWQLAHLHGDGE